MIKRLQIIREANWSRLNWSLKVPGDGWSIVFVISALIAGLAVALTVSQFGLITLIALPVLVIILATLGNPNLGLASLIILIFVQLQRVVTEFHELPGPGKPLVAFLVLVVAIRFVIFNDRPESWVKQNFLLGIYFLFLVLSTITAKVFAPALSELIDVSQNLIVASLILYILQGSSSLKTAIWSIIFAGMLMATISIYQKFTGTFSNEYWGFGGWEYSGYVDRPRLTGPYATPNPYAQVLVVIIILALDRMWHDSRMLWRLVAFYALVVNALAMIYTDSRGGFANLVFTLFVFFLFNRPRLLTLLMTIVIGVTLFQLLPSNYTSRILTLGELNPFQQSPEALTDESFRGRMSENLAAWEMFLDHPIFGVGLNNYAEFYQDYSRVFGLDSRLEARDPASLYLQLLADQGAVGSIVFLTLIVSIFIALWRSHGYFRTAGMFTEMKIAAALFSALAGYMFMALYRNNAYTNVFWVLVAICMATCQFAYNVKNSVESKQALELTP